MSAKKRMSADLAAEVGRLRDLVTVQDAMLGIRNRILLEHALTPAQQAVIAAVDAQLEDRPGGVRK